jgi:hypothetical protein
MPKYDDATESDVFILSGAEDLVPAFRLTEAGDVELDGHNRPVPDAEDRGGHYMIGARICATCKARNPEACGDPPNPRTRGPCGS